MVIIFYILVILGISGFLTFLVYKIKTSSISIPKIVFPKINFPKIKIPSFKKKPKGQIIAITSTTPSENIFQDIEVELKNGEFKRTVKKQSNNPFPSLGKKYWMISIGVVVIYLAGYYMVRRRK